MTSIDPFPQWRRERNAALMALDRTWFHAQIKARFGTEPAPDVLEATMHKTRYACRDLPDEPRLDSARWLRERGLGAFDGDLLPEGMLP